MKNCFRILICGGLFASLSSLVAQDASTTPHERNVVSIRALDASAYELVPDSTRDGAGTFLAHRSGSLNEVLTVNYRMDGSADNGRDYEMLSGELVFGAGEHKARLVIRPVDDDVAERNEFVHVTIVPPVCIAIFPPPPGCYKVDLPSHATIVIRDNDQGANHEAWVHIVKPHQGKRYPSGENVVIEVYATN